MHNAKINLSLWWAILRSGSQRPIDKHGARDTKKCSPKIPLASTCQDVFYARESLWCQENFHCIAGSQIRQLTRTLFFVGFILSSLIQLGLHQRNRCPHPTLIRHVYVEFMTAHHASCEAYQFTAHFGRDCR